MKRSKLFIMPLIAFLAIYLGISSYTASIVEAASNFASIGSAGPIFPSQNLRNCDCSQDRYNCSDFASQGDAQACYWSCGAQGRGDIHKLDLDINMVACDALLAVQSPSQSAYSSPTPMRPAPTSTRPMPTPTRPMPTPIVSKSLRSCDCSQDRYDCSDFTSQDDAQACYWNCGAQGKGDVHKLDLDVNRVACDVEGLQSPVQSGRHTNTTNHRQSSTGRHPAGNSSPAIVR